MNKIKNYLSIFLIISILLCSCFFNLSIKIFATEITTAYINGSNVNVRETPSYATNDNIIEQISYISATVLEKKEISAQEIWYKISYTSSGVQKSGWIFYNSEYIQIVTYNPDAGFEEKIKAFPESYHDALRVLHAKYPNWEFIPDAVNTSFSSAVSVQTTNMRKQVQIGSSIQPVSWRSMGLGSYDWSKKEWVSTNGGWTGASREVIAYYMDPRNFLNNEEIYMFLDQRYDSELQNEEGVQKIIKGTFLKKNYTPASGETGGGSYVKVIMAAAQTSGVNPYIIASKIIQEQGVNGSSDMISGTYSGYEGYYNFFNIATYGSTLDVAILNGLTYAKNSGWNTRYKSILGGAELFGKNYILKGQDTYYYQDFNVHGGGSHQYAQAVHDAYIKGVKLANTYKSDTDMALNFKIPVFMNMPETVSAMPTKNEKRNNYYFTEISVEGLTPSFSIYNYNYDLNISCNTSIYITVPDGAIYVSDNNYNIIKGINTVDLEVMSETGYFNTYTLNIYAENNCILSIYSKCNNHNFTEKGNNYIKSNATCVTPAEYYFECSECGIASEDSYTFGLPLGHLNTECYIDVEPTFVSTGKEIKKCLECNEIIDEIEIKKLLLGDANRDGITNSLDLVNYRKMLTNHITFDKYQTANSDFNLDSKVDIKDLVRIKKFFVGIYS